MLDKLTQHAEHTFATRLEQGSDDELFISSYLQGHFDLILCQVDQSAEDGVAQLCELMVQSLQQAFDARELELEDQKKVLALWDGIVQIVTNPM